MWFVVSGLGVHVFNLILKISRKTTHVWLVWEKEMFVHIFSPQCRSLEDFMIISKIIMPPYCAQTFSRWNTSAFTSSVIIKTWCIIYFNPYRLFRAQDDVLCQTLNLTFHSVENFIISLHLAFVACFFNYFFF